MGNEKAGSPVGKLLKLVASKNLTQAKEMQAASPEAICFPTDSTKIVFNGKEYGGDVNTVTSVAGKAGAVVLTKADVGLPNVDNTSDAAKPVSTATQAALNAKANAADVYKKTETYTKGEVDAKVSVVYKPKGSKATIAEVIALTDAKVGDVWDVKAEFTLSGKKYPASTNVVCVTATTSAAHTDANWDALGGTVDLTPYAKATDVNTQLATKVDKVTGKGLSTNDYTAAEKAKLAGITAGAQPNAVTSVAGRTGAVVLTKADVGLSNVSNTSDANKPISTATQSALNNKVDKVTGKGLSTNDYTSNEKTKLAGIPSFVLGASSPGQLMGVVPRPDAVNIRVNGVNTGAGGAGTSYTYAIPAATGTDAGVMTPADKKKVDTLSSINRYAPYLPYMKPGMFNSDAIKKILTPHNTGDLTGDVPVNVVIPKTGDVVRDESRNIGIINSVATTETSEYVECRCSGIAEGFFFYTVLRQTKSTGDWSCTKGYQFEFESVMKAISIS